MPRNWRRWRHPSAAPTTANICATGSKAGRRDEVEARRPSRRMNRPVSASRLALGAILGLAVVLRLYQIGFGLPGLYDPDEPLFIVMGAGLLTRGTLNPHWFGHPGSTTIYLTALIQALVFLTGWLSGRFATVAV